MSETSGRLTLLRAGYMWGNLIVASLIGRAAPLRHGKSVFIPYIGSLLAR